MSTRLRTLIGGAALLLTASIGLAAPASADAAPSVSSEQSASARSGDTKACIHPIREDGTRFRAAPNLGAAVVGVGYAGDCATSNSYTETGQHHQCEYSGKWTSTWYNLTNHRTGVTGWVSGCLWP